MKERLAPTPRASSYAVHLASVIISWNAPGHEKEYLINLPGLIGTIGDEIIPQPMADDLQVRLGEDWVLSNRGQRLEVYGMGNRCDEFVVGAVMTYFDQYTASHIPLGAITAEARPPVAISSENMVQITSTTKPGKP